MHSVGVVLLWAAAIASLGIAVTLLLALHGYLLERCARRDDERAAGAVVDSILRSSPVLGSPPPRFVDFEAAYSWRCPDCGHVNLVRQFLVEEGEPLRFDVDGKEAIMHAYSCGPVATAVHCLKCEERFEQRPAPPIIDDD